MVYTAKLTYRGYDSLKNYKGLIVCLKERKDPFPTKASIKRINTETFKWIEERDINHVSTYSQNVADYLNNKGFNPISINSLENMKKAGVGTVDGSYSKNILFEPNDWGEYLGNLAKIIFKKKQSKLEEILELNVRVSKGFMFPLLFGQLYIYNPKNVPQYFEWDTEKEKMNAESQRFNEAIYAGEKDFEKAKKESLKRIKNKE